jgi:NitT/TauT family transport system permease protein
MGADRWTILRRVIIPAALPAIFAGLRIALPIALTVVVVTEMIGDTKGLGTYIAIWSTRFNYGHVYAGIAMIGLCGFTLDQSLVRCRALAIPWQTGEVLT